MKTGICWQKSTASQSPIPPTPVNTAPAVAVRAGLNAVKREMTVVTAPEHSISAGDGGK